MQNASPTKLKIIAPWHLSIPKNAKSQEKDHKSYKSDDPSLGYCMLSYEIRGNEGIVQVYLVVTQAILMISPPQHSNPQDIYINWY